MTGNLALDWAVQAVSVFNAIVTTWLGLTILLNAERRQWGIGVASGGLLFAALFFISHSIILSEGFNVFSGHVDLWWHIGWWPTICLPLLWYMVTLWYAGFWERKLNPPDFAPITEAGGAHPDLYRRQRVPFILTVGFAGALAVLLLVANPLPSLALDARHQLNPTPASIGGIPLIIAAYPIYSVLCIGLSLDALLRPGPSERLMGDLARRRARPWLIATDLALLVVSLLVAWIMFWLARNATRDLLTIAFTIAIADLIIAVIIAVSILCVGQAIVAYEVFTGKALPRRGLQRHWYRAIILATGFAAVVSAGLTLRISPIYQVLSATALMTVFYALLSWRLFSERERYMHQLRPFVTSQRLYDHLVTPSLAATPLEADVVEPLRALADEVLDARQIVLAPMGPLAPLVGPPVSHHGHHPSLPSLTEITAQLTSPQTMSLRLAPERFGGAQWAVPLWNERGLIGLLLLSEKNDRGLYQQEEIEIARATGERLIDTRASAEMARRLMALQRQRLAESQVVDRRARRVLHDDILPQVHTALLSLNTSNDSAEAIKLLADIHRRISDLLHDLPAAAPDVTRAGLVGALKHLLNSELPDAFDAVNWHIDPDAEQRVGSLPPLTAEVVFYAAREAVRNAAKYGRGQNAGAHIQLELRIALTWRDGLNIAIEDNGVGMAASQGTDDGSSGKGLTLHSTLLAVVGGTLAVEALPSAGTRVLLSLPEY